MFAYVCMCHYTKHASISCICVSKEEILMYFMFWHYDHTLVILGLLMLLLLYNISECWPCPLRNLQCKALFHLRLIWIILEWCNMKNECGKLASSRRTGFKHKTRRRTPLVKRTHPALALGRYTTLSRGETAADAQLLLETWHCNATVMAAFN